MHGGLVLKWAGGLFLRRKNYRNFSYLNIPRFPLTLIIFNIMWTRPTLPHDQNNSEVFQNVIKQQAASK